MPLSFLKGLTADVKLSNKEYVKNEKERDVPWSLSPFKEPKVTTHAQVEEEGEEEESESPEWLELAGDLAWSATFSSLTSNTSVTEPIAVWNYGVFFALAWHLWATQTTYDIKYYTNDWWHRSLFACQLAMYAVLAAFSGSFTIGWEIDSGTMDVFTGNSTTLTADVIRENETRSMVKSLTGVNIILFINRLLLLAQYVRVLWYRRKTDNFRSWRFYLPAIATSIAASLFLTCYIMVKEAVSSKGVAITQLTLWGLALGVQVLSATLTPEDDEKVLKNKGSMPPRLSNLTVIILGEGLNGICDTLRHSINSLGLSKTTGSEMVAMLFILYFIWILYFDGFRIQKKVHKAVQEIWLWFHFPFQLALIMMLEGIKNIFIFATVRKANIEFVESLNDVFTYVNQTGNWPAHPPLEHLLIPVKISWEQELQDLTTAEQNNPNDPDTAGEAQLVRWLYQILHGIYSLFNDEPDPEAEFKYNQYLSLNDSLIVQDYEGDGSQGDAWANRYDELMSYSGHWLVAISGVLLISMAIINIVQRLPENRFAWGYSLNRIVMGVILLIVGGATSKQQGNESWVFWMIPSIAIAYGLCAVIDWVILRFSIHSIHKKEESFPSPNMHAGGEKGGYHSDRGVNLRQLSTLSYGRDSIRKGSTSEYHGVGQDASHDEVFDPYAEAGAPYYPRKRTSESSSDPTRQSLLYQNRE